MSHIPVGGGYPSFVPNGGMQTSANSHPQPQEMHDQNFPPNPNLAPPPPVGVAVAEDDNLDRYQQIYDTLNRLTNFCTDFEVTRPALPLLHHMYKVVERNHARHVVPVPYEMVHYLEQRRIKEELFHRRMQQLEQEDAEYVASRVSRFENQQQGQPGGEEPVSFVMPQNPQPQNHQRLQQDSILEEEIEGNLQGMAANGCGGGEMNGFAYPPQSQPGGIQQLQQGLLGHSTPQIQRLQSQPTPRPQGNEASISSSITDKERIDIAIGEMIYRCLSPRQ